MPNESMVYRRKQEGASNINSHWHLVWQVLHAGTRQRNVITEIRPPKQPHIQPVLGLHVLPLPKWDRGTGDAISFLLSLKNHSFDVASGESLIALFHLSENCTSLLLGNVAVQVNLELLCAVGECKIQLWVLSCNMLKTLIHIIIPSSLKITLKLILFLQHPLKNCSVVFFCAAENVAQVQSKSFQFIFIDFLLLLFLFALDIGDDGKWFSICQL